MLTIPLDAAAQRVVKGRVVDPAGAPVPYVTVQIGATNTISDDSGRFVIKAPASPVSLRFRRIGFRAGEVDLIAGGDTAIVVSLASLPLELERTMVAAQRTVRSLELRGFYQRLADREKGINAGQFITAEEIEQRNPTRVTQMFEGRTGIRNIRYKPPFGSGPGVVEHCKGPTALMCWAPHGASRCPMAVYMDGIRVPTVDVTDPNAPTLIDEIALPSHVAGVEIYTTAGKAPPEFQRLNGLCGVVLIWSK
jgi:hypothetical protein